MAPAATVVPVGLYYVLPLDKLASVPTGVTLVVGTLTLFTVAAGQLGQILRAAAPAVRAAEALATTVPPVPAVVFPSAYSAMSGTGDITAVSQTARLAVTVQMILDLLVLGRGIQVFIGAVRRARQGRPDPAAPDSPTAQ